MSALNRSVRSTKHRIIIPRTRAYLNGVLDKIMSQIETVSVSGNNKDATMAFRRQLVIRGVLDHVKHETYRRKTAIYEQEKIDENADIYTNGVLTQG